MLSTNIVYDGPRLHCKYWLTYDIKTYRFLLENSDAVSELTHIGSSHLKMEDTLREGL